MKQTKEAEQKKRGFGWKRRITGIIACVVVFATTYALVLPAITLDARRAANEAGLSISSSTENENENPVAELETEAPVIPGNNEGDPTDVENPETPAPAETEAPSAAPEQSEDPTAAPAESEAPSTEPENPETPAPEQSEDPTAAPAESEAPTAAPEQSEEPTSTPEPEEVKEAETIPVTVKEYEGLSDDAVLTFSWFDPQADGAAKIEALQKNLNGTEIYHAFDLELTEGEIVDEELGATITLSPYVPEKGAVLYHFTEDGGYEELNYKVDEEAETLMFATTSFSSFAFGKAMSKLALTETSDQDQKSSLAETPEPSTELRGEPGASNNVAVCDQLTVTASGLSAETVLTATSASDFYIPVKTALGDQEFRTLFALEIGFSEALIGTAQLTVTGNKLNNMNPNSWTLFRVADANTAVTVSYTFTTPNSVSFTTTGPATFVLAAPLQEGETNLHLSWSFKWINGGGSRTGTYHYVDNEKTYLLFHPQEYKSIPNATLQVEVYVAGSSDNFIPAGSVHMEIPAGIFFGWDGEKVDNVSAGSLPQKPGTNNLSDFWWYTGTNDYNESVIIIENHSDFYGGTKFTAEFSYKVDPLDVNGGYPDEEAVERSGYDDPFYASGASSTSAIDNYCWTNLIWKDYFVNDQVKCHIRVNSTGGEIEHDDFTYLTVGLMTRGGGVIHAISTQNDPKNGVYLNWQNSWGTKPSNADDYFYVVWNVLARRIYGQAREIQPWEGDMAYANDAEHPAITIGEQTFVGEYVGAIHSGLRNNEATYYISDKNSAAYTNIGTQNRTNFRWSFSSHLPSAHHLWAQKTGYNSVNANNNDGRDSIIDYTDGSSTASNLWLRPGLNFAILVKYPFDDVVNACNEINPETGSPYVDLANDGLPIIGRFSMSETWASGYQPVRTGQGNARLFLRDGSGAGVFSKARSDVQDGKVEGAQTILAQYNKPIQLPYATTYGGAINYPYLMTYDGTSATREDRVLGQRIVITEEKLMLSSGNATHRNGWSPEGPNANAYPTGDGDGNLILEDADYSIPRFNVVTFNEYYGTGSHGIWEANAAISTDYQNYPYLLIYTRTAGETMFEPYCAVRKVSSPNQYGRDNAGTRAYLWNGEKNADGTPVLGAELQLNNYAYRIDRENVVQIQYVLETPATPADAQEGVKYGDYFRTLLAVAVHVKLNPTERVKAQIDKDLLASCDTYVKNIASCKVYDVETNGASSEPRISVDNVGTNNASDVIIKLTRISDSLVASKEASVPGNTSAAQQTAAQNNKQIAYISLYAENRVQLDRGTQWSNVGILEPYKLLKGTFYDLLPKGTSIEEGSVIGVYHKGYTGATGPGIYRTLQSYISQNKTKQWLQLDNAHKGYIFTSGFSYRTEYIPELDQYLLIIDYETADPGFSPGEAGEHHYWHNGVAFYFILENSFVNIRAHGNSTPNRMGFEFTRENGAATTANESKVTTISASVRAPFQEIADRNDKSAFSQYTIGWNALTVLQAGFTKLVSIPETINSMPQTADNSDLGRVTVGNRYQYHLLYTTEGATKSDQIVLYDILESGTSGVNESEDSDWQGSFVSLDISQIKTLKDAENANVKCNPVVYYSTTLTEKVAIDQTWADLNNGMWIKWSENPPTDPADVTAIAIDCRLGTDGNPFHMAVKTTMMATINMVAPTEMQENPDAKAVNGAVVSFRYYSATPGDHGDASQLMSRASVMLRDVDVSLIKASNPATGTASARTQVKADGTGTIAYRLTVRNNMPFDINNVIITDPIPAGLTIDHVTVKLNGAGTERPVSAVSGFTYTLGADGRTCTFTIAKQYPTIIENNVVTTNKDTEIYIYTTVDELKDGNTQVLLRDYDNTARLVSANGKTINEFTDTMYHRAETVAVPVTKVWDDNNGRDGLRPEAVQVTLIGTAGGEEVVRETAMLNAQGNWVKMFSVPKYAVDDSATSYAMQTTYEPMVYTVEETLTIDPYIVSYSGNMTDGFTITNKLEYEIQFAKVDEFGEYVSGAKVQIFDYSAMDYDDIPGLPEWTTNATNNPRTIALKPGIYCFAENQVPTGYYEGCFDVFFIIEADGTVKISEQVTGDWLNDNSFESLVFETVESPVTITIVNETNKVMVTKVDQDNRLVSGAVLAVIEQTSSGSEVGVVDTWTTAANDDPHVVTRLKTGNRTRYVLRELSAPPGYEYAADIIFRCKRDSDGNPYVEIQQNGSWVRQEGLTITMVDSCTYELPATGGSGNTMLYIIGVILMLGAGVALGVAMGSKRRCRED